MRWFLILCLLPVTPFVVAPVAADPADIPEPPDLPMPVQSGETLEPDITIIRKGEDTIYEYRRNGDIYMVKVVPAVGPAYYLVDSDGDGQMDARQNGLDRGTNINQWKLFQWK